MPGRNGSGPAGMGPMTGRGMGPCAGGNAIGAGQGYGMGMGYGRGMRCGYGRGYGITAGANLAPLPQDEVTLLKNQAEFLKNNLDGVNQRISQLEEKK